MTASVQECVNTFNALLTGPTWLYWLQPLAWIGTAIGALIAADSLRRNAKQARANFLLSLYPRWEALSDSRQRFAKLIKEVSDQIYANPKISSLHRKHQEVEIRKEYRKQLEHIETTNKDELHLLFELLTFFETIGLMVRKRYVRLSDILQLYKGPIFDVENAFRLFIEDLQKRQDMPPGAFENLFYLIRRARLMERLNIVVSKVLRWR